jgi:hypothetical protein
MPGKLQYFETAGKWPHALARHDPQDDESVGFWQCRSAGSSRSLDKTKQAADMGNSTIYLCNLCATTGGYFQKRSGGPGANRRRALVRWPLEGPALICREQASFNVILSCLVTLVCVCQTTKLLIWAGS